MSHTPGPWTVKNKGRLLSIRSLVDDEVIAQVPYSKSEGLRQDRDYANASLIAAAPELLEALKKVAELDDWQKIPPATMVRVEEAIAKAEGK